MTGRSVRAGVTPAIALAAFYVVVTAGATFALAFDTHTGAPGIDVTENTRVVVDGTTWPAPTWRGDSAGGHHRSGALTFAAGGAARGTVRPIITGLDQPLDLRWQLTP